MEENREKSDYKVQLEQVKRESEFNFSFSSVLCNYDLRGGRRGSLEREREEKLNYDTTFVCSQTGYFFFIYTILVEEDCILVRLIS